MAIDVEQVVREVIAEFQRREGRGAGEGGCVPTHPPTEERERAPATPAQLPTSAAPREDPRELVVCSRVVSLREIADRLGHIRRIVVPAGAVITPAARDALDDHGVTVAYGATDGAAAAATAAKLVLVAARTTFNLDPLVGALIGEGIGVDARSSKCLVRTTDELAPRVRDGATVAVVLTHDVAAAVCLANRHAGVRAISAGPPAEAVESGRAVGANVLVMDPRGRGVFSLKQTISTFCRSAPWTCPETLRSRLG